MKECPYCKHMNEDDATSCGRCFAGFPQEEKHDEKGSNEKPEKASRTARKK